MTTHIGYHRRLGLSSGNCDWLRGLALRQPAFSVRDGQVQVGMRIGHECLHPFKVAAELLDAFLPGCIARRSIAIRPVSVGPGRRNVLRIDAELHNVPLGGPHMLRQMPSGERKVSLLHPAQTRGESADGTLKADVGAAAAAQQIEQVIAQSVVAMRTFCFLPGISKTSFSSASSSSLPD